MTYAPDTLIAARRLLVDTVPGLTGAEVGIVGDTGHAANASSYHLGKDQLRGFSYSIVESSRDRNGLTNAASALDIGEFQFSRGGKTHTLHTFSAWLVAQCEARTADTRDIREVIYSTDGQTVRRWDRLGLRSTGDGSHRWHTHISYFRDSEKKDKAGLFRRYLTETGLLEAEVTEAELVAAVIKGLKTWTEVNPDSTATPPEEMRMGGLLRMSWQRARNQHNALVALIGGLDTGADEPAIVAGVLAGLDPAAIAAAIPPELARQVADELAARLAS
jgi:hypothetical protein